jgi:hypothetical protein
VVTVVEAVVAIAAVDVVATAVADVVVVSAYALGLSSTLRDVADFAVFFVALQADKVLRAASADTCFVVSSMYGL